jgi:hypothetical protein
MKAMTSTSPIVSTHKTSVSDRALSRILEDNFESDIFGYIME